MFRNYVFERLFQLREDISRNRRYKVLENLNQNPTDTEVTSQFNPRFFLDFGRPFLQLCETLQHISYGQQAWESFQKYLQ